MAMRKLASTVSIVTTARDEAWHGIAVTSFTSVSLAPPTILVCINRDSEFSGHVRQAGKFCVSVLGDAHEEQCNIFGSGARRAERFTTGDWRSIDGTPALADAQAILSCTTFHEVECGTHITLFASVDAISLRETLTNPLVYLDGKVRQLNIAGLQSFRPQSSREVPQYG